MDKFWSIFTMPIGLIACFGPALIVWVKMELADAKKNGENGGKDKPQR